MLIAQLPRVQLIRPIWRKDPFDDPEWLFGAALLLGVGVATLRRALK